MFKYFYFLNLLLLMIAYYLMANWSYKKITYSYPYKLSNPLFISAVGSCNKHTLNQTYWDYVHRAQLNLINCPTSRVGGMIWLGDIVYLDRRKYFTSDKATLSIVKSAYRIQKKSEQYQKFINRSQHIIGVWDDHDFSCNNGGVHCPLKELAKEELLHFLDVPHSDLRWRPGEEGILVQGFSSRDAIVYY